MTQRLKYLSTKDLENQIEKLRYDMVTLGLTLGISNTKTLEISKTLDEYITEYQNRSGASTILHTSRYDYSEIS
ncbi:aspartyl-phosphate phosphatase Spo0E family protein [Pontibacillus marinus]|uniref:Sporulation protein Spo0E n=1 Tax=Pontibacillus marinus BH030004 = DSM 16465 TaxID=1385511 RepID=A0A0A5GIG3_9BACI|nr:aspartyl-phosphate phosphatase Spo0E family protein [Pontibacillus marinus]KGX91819.1 sporulation protein Spo0E [Pontibacillus marinus BH030004 = DSM 16465]